jgi:polysaccharide deacetylase family protein (PEP-CTERM system associated)
VPEADRPILFLSFDLEDRDQIEQYRTSGRVVPPSASFDDSIARILDLLDVHGARATFFVVGILARERSALLARIAHGGHELGIHGHTHTRVPELGPDGFRREIHQARSAVEDATGGPVHAFRAPAFSLRRTDRWALDSLAEEGFRIDSSIIPIRHPRYGDPRAPRAPYLVRPGLWEVPVSVAHVAGIAVPFAGGGFFRVWPTWVHDRLATSARRESGPPVYYFHPYDLAPDRLSLRIPGAPWRTRLSYLWADAKQNLGRQWAFPRLGSLLEGQRALPLSAALP